MSRISRRHFLTAVGLGSAGAAAALVAAPQAAEPAAKHAAAGADNKSRGYQVTAHVRRYYRTTRV